MADGTSTSEELRARIRASGLRSTAPRLAVLQRLEAERGPKSHAELCVLLASNGFDRATVYRNLMDLTEAGLVSRTDLGDHVWRFEARRAAASVDGHGRAQGRGAAGRGAHGGDHPHFVCTGCGAVSCLQDVKVEVRHVAAASPRRRSGGRRGAASLALGTVSEILLKGRCRSCS